jgi:hypothetical protein
MSVELTSLGKSLNFLVVAGVESVC